jgi:DNA-binding PadR family transcriptional regulator
MSEKKQSFDFRSVVDVISEAIRSAGNSASDTLRPAKVWSETGLRNAVLTALKGGAKTGHGVITSIHEVNEWGIRPTAARVYPLLESLLDEQLVSVAVVKDRKVYTLTKAGTAAEKAIVDADNNWDAPRLPSLSDELTKASARLAKAAFGVSQRGTQEQRDAATTVIDEARKKITEILTAK